MADAVTAPPDFSFRGTAALVTGASRNIGRAIALTLAAHGIAVAVNTRHSVDAAESVAEEITDRGGRAVVVVGDVGDPAACETIAARATEALGPVDYLVSNAASRRFQAFTEITPDQWDQSIRANPSALFYLGRVVLPGMRERGFGRIVALGGPDGYTGWHHRAHNVTP
jgi:3-oxoacyl-[acyl-carrier protein] reductase